MRLRSISRRQIILLVAAVLVVYLLLGLLNVPKPMTFEGGEDHRIFTVYTEENVREYVKIVHVGLTLNVADDGHAIGSMTVWMTSRSLESHVFDLLFVLPPNSDPIPESNQNVSSSTYAQVVRTRITSNSTMGTQIAEALFRWPDFSVSLRLGERGFYIDVSAFPPLRYDASIGHQSYSLMNRDFEPFQVYVSVNLTGDAYRFVQFYPTSGVSYGRSVAWSEDQSVLFLVASGTYEHFSRQAVDFAISAFVPLVIGLLGGLLLGSLPDGESKRRFLDRPPSPKLSSVVV